MLPSTDWFLTLNNKKLASLSLLQSLFHPCSLKQNFLLVLSRQSSVITPALAVWQRRGVSSVAWFLKQRLIKTSVLSGASSQRVLGVPFDPADVNTGGAQRGVRLEAVMTVRVSERRNHNVAAFQYLTAEYVRKTFRTRQRADLLVVMMVMLSRHLY